jgi:hypothetical protein
MRTTTMKKTIAIAAVAVFAGSMPVSGGETDTTPKPERARELKAQAEALYSQPKQWKRAVRLLEQSASLREANDPEVYSCLVYASRIQANLGEMTAARINLEKAGEHALARGSVIEAAHAFIDAAHVAVAEGKTDIARTMVERATLLSESPLLSAEQKKSLTRRIEA